MRSRARVETMELHFNDACVERGGGRQIADREPLSPLRVLAVD